MPAWTITPLPEMWFSPGMESFLEQLKRCIWLKNHMLLNSGLRPWNETLVWLSQNIPPLTCNCELLCSTYLMQIISLSKHYSCSDQITYKEIWFPFYTLQQITGSLDMIGSNSYWYKWAQHLVASKRRWWMHPKNYHCLLYKSFKKDRFPNLSNSSRVLWKSYNW